jgi:hypothetical protein
LAHPIFQFGEYLDSSDEASARRLSGTHSATSAGEPSQPDVPFAPLVQEGQLFGEKKAGMFSPRSTLSSGTRAAVENPSDDVKKSDRSSWADMYDDDAKQNQDDGGSRCVTHDAGDQHGDVGKRKAVDILTSVDVRSKTKVGKSQNRKARRRGRRRRKTDETRNEDETISSDAMAAAIDHDVTTTTPDLVRERNIDDATLPTSYLWLDQPPSMGDF